MSTVEELKKELADALKEVATLKAAAAPDMWKEVNAQWTISCLEHREFQLKKAKQERDSWKTKYEELKSKLDDSKNDDNNNNNKNTKKKIN